MDDFTYYKKRMRELESKFNLTELTVDLNGLPPRKKDGFASDDIAYEREALDRINLGKKMMVSHANYKKAKVRFYLEVSR